jgi:endonuclease-8
MPEGDTIHKAALAMRPLLEGVRLEAVRLRGGREAARFRDRAVARVEARGKHLLIHTEDGPCLRVHLGMYGRWHRYPRGAVWRRPARSASCVVETGDVSLVCFRAREVEVLDLPPRWSRALADLGPDLVDPSADLDDVVARARRWSHGDRPIHEVLLDQRVAAGIGNVFKSEVLFTEGIHPETPLAALGDDALRRLFAEAALQLRANVRPGARVTRGLRPGDAPHRPGQPRHHVYGRASEPCLTCGAGLMSARRGEQARVTYWCPACQPEQAESDGR